MEFHQHKISQENLQNEKTYVTPKKEVSFAINS